MQIGELTIAQLNAYIRAWSEISKATSGEDPRIMGNSDVTDIDMFNLSAGIKKVRVKK